MHDGIADSDLHLRNRKQYLFVPASAFFFRGLLHAHEFDICRTAHKGLNVPNSAHLCRTRLP
jgi:hypothetical protein